jgi:hypothetical protein
MGAVPLVVPAILDTASVPTADAARSVQDRSAADAARQDELMKCVVLQFGMCGALVNRDAIDFARGIAEILIWSAEHACVAANTSPVLHREQVAEWKCGRCGEPVPDNFDLCWNCELDRSAS